MSSSTPQVYDHYFGMLPSTLPPSTLVRRWDSAIIGATFCAGATYVVVGATVLYPALPWPVGGGMWLHLQAWPQVLLHWGTAGGWFADSAPVYLEAAWQVPWRVFGRMALTCGASGFVGWKVLTSLAKPRNNVRHVSGPQLLAGPEGEAAAKALSARLCSKEGAYMDLHPLLPLPKRTWSKHAIFYGAVGSGKTNAILGIISQVMADRDAKMLAYDIKGDFTSYFAEAAILSPWDARSVVWDIGSDLDNASSAQAFASSLFSSSGGSEAASFFSNAARIILTGCVLALQHERGKEWGWTDLAQKKNQDAQAMFMMLQKYAPEGLNFVRDPTAKSTGDVLSSITAATSFIDDLALAWGNGVDRPKLSFRRWCRDDYKGPHKKVVLGAGPNTETTQRFVSALMNVIVPNVISPQLPDDEMGRAIFFVFDELTSAGKFEVASLIDKGRSKGVTVLVGVQSISQIAMVHGDHVAKSLPGMVGTHIICQQQMGETRDAIANLIGKRRVAVVATSANASGTGVAVNQSVHEEARAIVTSTELSDLGFIDYGKRFVIRSLVVLAGQDVLVLDFPGMKLPKLRKANMRPAWMKAPQTAAKAAEAAATAATSATGPLTQAFEAFMSEHGEAFTRDVAAAAVLAEATGNSDSNSENAEGTAPAPPSSAGGGGGLAIEREQDAKSEAERPLPPETMPAVASPAAHLVDPWAGMDSPGWSHIEGLDD